MTDEGSVTAKGGCGLLLAGIVLGLLFAAGVYVSQRGEGGRQEVDAEAVVTHAPAESNDVDAVAEVPVEPGKSGPEAEQLSGVSEREQDLAEETPDAETVQADAPEVEAPTIDEVRVDNEGLMVIAGRAEPGSRVDVLVDGEVVTSTDADSSGSFAALGSVPASDGAQSLTLQSGNGESAIASEEEIILAPVASAAPDNVIADSAQVAAAPEVVTEPVADRTETVETAEPLSNAPVAVTSTETIETQAQPEQAEPPTELATTEIASAAEPVAEAPSVEERSGTKALEASRLPIADQPVAHVPKPIVTAEAEQIAAQEQTLAEPDPEVATGSTDDVNDAADAEPFEAAPKVAETQAEEEDTQIAVLRSDASGVSLVQPAPSQSARVMLDTISYSDDGTVQLGGRAGASAVEVRAYLDNFAVASLAVNENGTWRGEVPGVAPGVYRLRIDALAENGKVTSRMETPFKREAPAVLAAATAGDTGPVSAVTVQTGDTLWAIARERYGEGILFVQVFEANRDSIRDPDLIYPGQVFDLPDD